ncbi:MAG: DNA glycosylase [Oscillospiraceae bacterium]
MSFTVTTSDFSLGQTLECGQCFRWRPDSDGRYVGVAHGKLLSISQCGDTLEIEGCGQEEYEEWLRSYLGLDEPYDSFKATLSRDAVLCDAISYAPGIRVMKQPLWETLCSFIISQNNNITRITKIVDTLCRCFGTDLGGYFDFPSPRALAELDRADLACLVCGYRDVYIMDAAQRFANGLIDENFVQSAPLCDARDHLMTIKGVGPKVADCVLLFGAQRYDAFPRDVWIKRAMAELFPNGLPDYALPIAGIAQQYIFHYARKSGIFER